MIYFGTVAAVMESRFALAVSLVGHNYFEAAAEVVVQLMKDFHTFALSAAGILLNVNVVDVLYNKLKEVPVTRLGYRHKAQALVFAKYPRVLLSFWISALSEPDEVSEGSGFYAVENGGIPITLIHTDMTCCEAPSFLEKWTNTVTL